MVELVDTLDLGSSLKKVGVRVSFKVKIIYTFMVELVDTINSKFIANTRAGSNPAKSK